MTADLRYPIGYPGKGTSFTAEERAAAVEHIALLPQALRAAVKDFSEERLETPYRPEGWTVRQLIHHVADSHMNAYIRVRLGLTQDWPTISPYDENRWAGLADARSAAVGASLDLLEALHSRCGCNCFDRWTTKTGSEAICIRRMDASPWSRR